MAFKLTVGVVIEKNHVVFSAPHVFTSAEAKKYEKMIESGLKAGTVIEVESKKEAKE